MTRLASSYITGHIVGWDTVLNDYTDYYFPAQLGSIFSLELDAQRGDKGFNPEKSKFRLGEVNGT
jgi:hypothetical protein